jgi:hypothetical protein
MASESSFHLLLNLQIQKLPARQQAAWGGFVSYDCSGACRSAANSSGKGRLD